MIRLNVVLFLAAQLNERSFIKLFLEIFSLTSLYSYFWRANEAVKAGASSAARYHMSLLRQRCNMAATGPPYCRHILRLS